MEPPLMMMMIEECEIKFRKNKIKKYFSFSSKRNRFGEWKKNEWVSDWERKVFLDQKFFVQKNEKKRMTNAFASFGQRRRRRRRKVVWLNLFHFIGQSVHIFLSFCSIFFLHYYKWLNKRKEKKRQNTKFNFVVVVH